MGRRDHSRNKMKVLLCLTLYVVCAQSLDWSIVTVLPDKTEAPEPTKGPDVNIIVDDCQWTTKQSHQAYGALRRGDIKTVEDCKKECKGRSDCNSIDWNKHADNPFQGARCWLHIKEHEGLVENKDVDHLECLPLLVELRESRGGPRAPPPMIDEMIIAPPGEEIPDDLVDYLIPPEIAVDPVEPRPRLPPGFDPKNLTPDTLKLLMGLLG